MIDVAGTSPGTTDLVQRFRNSNHMRRHSGAPPTGPAFGRPDDRLRGEPGIHNHWPRVMDSGLATCGGAPE